jgi:ankyrin repeat protein
MSNSKLPSRASLEYLKKLSKDRLRELRRAEPQARLAAAQLAVAREYGFPSWRALKAEVEFRQVQSVATFFDACARGDVEALRSLLAHDPGLVRAGNPAGRHAGWTGLHSAAQHGHADAVRLLLEHGADANAREAGDNTCALHWAAAHGHVEAVRVLLDAGSDVHGAGDVHLLDVIGWATFYHAPDRGPGGNPEVVALLLERGARHHIFSAIAVGDLELIRNLVSRDREALDRRMSRFEHGHTPLHFAMSLKRHDILDLLIGLGADLEAEDAHGQTPLATAMVHGDRDAMRRLHEAGAKQPEPVGTAGVKAGMAALAASVRKGVPMISVPDIAATLDWYVAIGFREIARYEDDGVVNFGMLAFGRAEIMLNLYGKPGTDGVSLWFYTDQVDRLYRLLKSRQLLAAQAALTGEPGAGEGIEFVEDIYDPFYGGRQFGIRDLNGYTLTFLQE